ncbi:MAG: response regulator [Bryobacteraceae bacterium]
MASGKYKNDATQILVVEDNRADVKLLRCALETTGDWKVDLTVVGDGDKAVAYLEQSGAYGDRIRPDLVILDLNLPKRTGPEILRWIRTHSELYRLPAVLLSSNPRDFIRQQVAEEGVEADGYFTKPGDFHQLVAILGAIKSCYEEASRRLLKMPPRSAGMSTGVRKKFGTLS